MVAWCVHVVRGVDLVRIQDGAIRGGRHVAWWCSFGNNTGSNVSVLDGSEGKLAHDVQVSGQGCSSKCQKLRLGRVDGLILLSGG